MLGASRSRAAFAPEINPFPPRVESPCALQCGGDVLARMQLALWDALHRRYEKMRVTMRSLEYTLGIRSLVRYRYEAYVMDSQDVPTLGPVRSVGSNPLQ